MLLKHKVNRLLRHPGCNKKSGGGDTTTVQKSDPWEGIQPFLNGTGTDGTPTGIYQQAYNLWNQNQSGIQPYGGPTVAQLPGSLQNQIWSTMNYGNQLLNSPIWGQMQGTLGGLLGGNAYQDTNAMMVGAPEIYLDDYNWLGVDPVRANAAQSGWATINNPLPNANPAIWQQLYGGPDNPWLNGMAMDMVNKTGQSWRDMSDQTVRGLTEQVLPQISRNFNYAGQLGQSRQALSTGQAVGDTYDALLREGGDMNTNLMGQLSNLYGGAYENQMGRSASLASQLAGLGTSTNTNQAQLIQQALMQNAANQQQANLANQGVGMQSQLANQAGLQNYYQLIQQGQLANQAANLQTMGANQALDLQSQMSNQDAALKNAQIQLQALGIAPNVLNMPYSILNQNMAAYSPLQQQQQALYNAARSMYYEGANAPYNALMQYANIIQPGTGIGGTVNSSTDGGGVNPLAGALGGAALGSALGSSALGYSAISSVPWLTYSMFPWLGAAAGLMFS